MESKVIKKLTISPSKISAKPAEEIRMTAHVYDENGHIFIASDPFWSTPLNDRGVAGGIISDGTLRMCEEPGEYKIGCVVWAPKDEEAAKLVYNPGTDIDIEEYKKKFFEIRAEADLTVLEEFDTQERQKPAGQTGEEIQEIQEQEEARPAGQTGEEIQEIQEQEEARPAGQTGEEIQEIQEQEEVFTPFKNKKWDKSKQYSPRELKKVSDEELIQKTQLYQHKITYLGHTRAIYRTFGANKDLVWLSLCCICAMAIGTSVVLVIYGVSMEKVAYFFGSLLGFLGTFFAKIYTPPGEISESIHDKILGVTPEEKVKALEAKIKELKERITSNMYGKHYYKYTMDESSVIAK